MAAVDGPTLAAWRYRIAQDGFTCRLDLGVGDGFVGFVLSYFVDDPRGRVDQVFHTEIGHLAELEVDPIAVIAPGVTSQRVSVSAELVAFWTGAWAVGVDVPSGRVAFLNEPLGGIPQNVTVVGDQVFWEDWADLVRVASATLDVTASLFHRADPGDVKGFRTDGVDFAWFEGYDRHPDGRYDRLELWTAPFTRDPAALSPRRVRAMEIRSGSMYGGGWYVVQRGAPNGYDVVNVRDGSLRRIAAGGGVMPLYVAEHEILFSTVRWDPNTLPLVEEP
ncbi:MAG: hypothetical protein KF729_16900 [Sandaracinaceae bacterium]|nr:hypothetical protein [Sandaracinaceae bacterium]